MVLNDSEMLTVSKAAKYLGYPSWLLLQWLKCNLLRLLYCSLVPRSFPLSMFDCLQYTNAEGEGLGDLVVWLHKVDRK